MTDLRQAAHGTYAFIKPPKPVGYWVLNAHELPSVRFFMHHKPRRLHIWFTEKLLGWKWEDA